MTCNLTDLHFFQLVVADYIQSELQLKEGREKGELHELDGTLYVVSFPFFHNPCEQKLLPVALKTHTVLANVIPSVSTLQTFDSPR